MINFLLRLDSKKPTKGRLSIVYTPDIMYLKYPNDIAIIFRIKPVINRKDLDGMDVASLLNTQ